MPAVGDGDHHLEVHLLVNYGDLNFKWKLYGVTIQKLSVRSTLDGTILFEIHCKAVLGIFLWIYIVKLLNKSSKFAWFIRLEVPS